MEGGREEGKMGGSKEGVLLTFYSAHVNRATSDMHNTILTNQNLIHDEIKAKLNLGAACYYSNRNLFSFSWLHKTQGLKHTELNLGAACYYSNRNLFSFSWLHKTQGLKHTEL